MQDGVVIDRSRCKGCGLCIATCPVGCLVFDEAFDDCGYHPVIYSGKGCRLDGLCADACPEPGAITIRGALPGSRSAAASDIGRAR